MVPSLVRILKNLITSGYSPEHDVSGVSDPFLQIKILRLLRILGHGDPEASEAMNDLLAQVATNTEGSKNVGNAILYETVISIMDIKSEGALRVLGINILGRFLLNSDKNIRYVALNTLLKTFDADLTAVQRHRTTITECLKDPDGSLRKKAMQLCFALINASNIKTISKELLSYLQVAEPENKCICSSNLFHCADRYSPSVQWQIDTLVQVLTLAGNYVRDDLVCSVIQLISEQQDTTLQSYALAQLWLALKGDLQSKQPLVQVAMWSLGEYGDQLLDSPAIQQQLQLQAAAAAAQQQQNGLDQDGELMSNGGGAPLPAVTNNIPTSTDDLLDKCEAILLANGMSAITKEYAMNALIKLAARLPSTASRVKRAVDFFASHHNIELQQRASEFSSLFTRHDNLRPGLFEKMPPIPRRKDLFVSEAVEEETATAHSRRPAHEGQSAPASKPSAGQPVKSNADELLGLDSAFVNNSNASTTAGNHSDALLDLLCLDQSLPTPSVHNDSSILMNLSNNSTTTTPSNNMAAILSSAPISGSTSGSGTTAAASNVLDLLDL